MRRVGELTSLAARSALLAAVSPWVLLQAASAAHAQAVTPPTQLTVAQPAPATLAPAQPAAETQATLSLPVTSEGRPVGFANARISVSTLYAVSASDLLLLLEPSLNEETKAALKGMGSDLQPVERVRALGLQLDFDPGSLSLAISVPASIRGAQISTAPAEERHAGLERIQPSDFAIGVTGTLVSSSRLDAEVDPTTFLGISGFLNVGGAEGVNLVYGGDIALTGGDGRLFRRDRVVAFMDDPQTALRYSAGDLFPVQPRLAGQYDILGVSLERNYEELQPQRNIRPVGRRSFALERASLVEVYVNGALVRTFRAEPGPIDIRDIPSANIGGAVSIVVEDDLGRRELDSFALGADLTLLADGIAEFSVSAGLLRDSDDISDFNYTGNAIVGGYYSRGLSNRLTVTGHAVVAAAVQNAGASAAFMAFGGVALVETAFSNTEDHGAGLAIGLSYRGDPFGFRDRNAFLNFRLDYQSRNFATLTSFRIVDDIKLDVSADYRLDLTDATSVSFGASYFERYGPGDPQTSVFAGVAQRFGALTAFASARYATRADGREEFGGFLTLSLPLDRRTVAFASYDFISDTARAEVRRRRSLSLPEFEYSLRAERTPDEMQLGGRVGFATSRFEAVGDVSKLFASGGGEDPLVGTVRLQSGIAFVDGRVGVGRDPGIGFVMVSRHPSLSNSQVEVLTSAVGRELAAANDFGPAVVPVFAPFRSQEMRVNVLDAPVGYDIGPGEYVLFPGARSGMSIVVGSDAFRTAIGVLRRADGTPVALSSGQLTWVETGETTSFFTNRAGRVAFNRLSPGRYRGTIDSGGLAFEFTVAEDSGAYLNLDVITVEPVP